MAMKQEVNVPLIAAIGTVSVILLVTTVIGASAWYFAVDQDVNAQNFDLYPDQTVIRVQDGQRARINSPAHWVDATHTVVAIPIDEAMQVVIATQGKVPMAGAPASAGSK
jgi:hypothetical protein